MLQMRQVRQENKVPSQTPQLLSGKDGAQAQAVWAGEEVKGQFCSQNCDLLVYRRGSQTL